MEGHFIGVFNTTSTICSTESMMVMYEIEIIVQTNHHQQELLFQSCRQSKENGESLGRNVTYNVPLSSSAKNKARFPINSTGTNFFTACFCKITRGMTSDSKSNIS